MIQNSGFVVTRDGFYSRVLAMLIAALLVAAGAVMSPVGGAPARADSGYSISGRVVADIPGNPGIPWIGVRVFKYQNGSWDIWHSDSSYTDGYYSIDFLDAGSYKVGFYANWYEENGQKIFYAGQDYYPEIYNNIQTDDPNVSSATVLTVGPTVGNATGINAALTPVGLEPVGESIPTVSGTARVGQTLRASVSGWVSGASLAYQWLSNGAAVRGATKSTYVPVPADAGKKITVRVTGTKAGYTTVTKTSAATRSVAKGKLTASPTPKITGTKKVGKTLKVTSASKAWRPAKVTLTYRWYANGKAIKGATKATYKLTRAQKGKRITVKVTGKKTGYNTVSKTSTKTTRIK